MRQSVRILDAKLKTLLMLPLTAKARCFHGYGLPRRFAPRNNILIWGPSGGPEEIRFTMVCIPSSRNAATVHWTVALNCSNLLAEEKRDTPRWVYLFFGGPEEIRTPDPYNANVMRSQLRYRPIIHGDYFLIISLTDLFVK